MPDPLFAPTPRAHAIRLDVRGTTASGTDGHDTAQRILRDLASHAFGQSPHFTIGVPGKDLPPRFAWRLEVVFREKRRNSVENDSTDAAHRVMHASSRS